MPLLSSGIIATAIDANGQAWPVTYQTLTNGGSGNGVLICANLGLTPHLPRILALGPVHWEEATGGPTLGYWQFQFESFVRYAPVLRGHPIPGQHSQTNPYAVAREGRQTLESCTLARQDNGRPGRLPCRGRGAGNRQVGGLAGESRDPGTADPPDF